MVCGIAEEAVMSLNVSIESQHRTRLLEVCSQDLS